MQLHLVGGFLGSGKTTAIGSACELLRSRGLRAAVVTNDQGEMLVDTGALVAAGVAAGEVTGGCFCCRYDELVERIIALAAGGAEHLFAEAAGSCVDVVRTVVNPLRAYRPVKLEAVTFSVFADARLLTDYLRGRPLPWSNPALRYLFERQLAEAPLLIAAKADLLDAPSPVELNELAAVLQAALPGQRLLLQDSRTAAGVAGWLHDLRVTDPEHRPGDGDALLPGVEVDYARYGAAEAALAWNDREVELSGVEGRATEAAAAVIEQIADALHRRPTPIGHLKFLIRDHYRDAKVSITGADLPPDRALRSAAWREQLPPLAGDRVMMIVNARVEMDAAALERLVDAAVSDAAASLAHDGAAAPVRVRTRSRSAFHPAYPEPVHRLVPR